MKRLFSQLVLVGLGSLTLLQGSSTLNFPRLSFLGDELTGVAIANPGAQNAVVTFTAYGEDGQQLAGLDNPVQRVVPAGGQYSALTSEIFGMAADSSTRGWFQVTSSSNDLTGFFLFLNGSLPFRFFDGADLPGARKRILFSQVQLEEGHATELNLINPTDRPASIELRLTGNTFPPLIRNLALPARGLARLDVAEFFTPGEGISEAYITATADTEISGFEFVRTPQGDLVGLNARSLDEKLTHLYFPQLAVLGGIQTRVGVINGSDASVILTLSAYQETGLLFGPEQILGDNPVTRPLGPGEVLLEDLETMFGFQGETTQAGWLEVESTAPSITGFVTYGSPTLGAAATVVSSRTGQTRGIFSHFATAEGFFSGVALLNPGQIAANVQIVALQLNGEPLGSATASLGPGQRRSELITNLIPAAQGQDAGLLFIKSNVPVYLSSIFGTDSLSILANVPPQPSPATYDPSAGLPTLEVRPPLAILQPGGTQSFQLLGGAGTPVWLVNDQESGDATVGVIDGQGNYTAPALAPSPETVTISARLESQSAGASVDVLERQSLLSSASTVRSVAYLRSSALLYTAELTLLGGFGAGHSPAQQTPGSEIFEVAPGPIKLSVAELPNEEISKMIAFVSGAGKEYLLLAARSTGRVLRLDPLTRELIEVASELDQPNALAIDSASGDVLVAERTRVSILPADQVEGGSAALLPPGDPRTQTAGPDGLFETDAIDGLVVDRCTGNVYLSQRELGRILRFNRVRGGLEVLFEGLTAPTRLLGIYRSRIACPQSFELLGIESGTDQVRLLRPGSLENLFWFEALGSTDLAFLPAGQGSAPAASGPSQNPFVDRNSVLLTENIPAEPEGNGVTAVAVPRSYLDVPGVNEPQPTPLAITTLSPLPTGTIDLPYQETLEAEGGVPPYDWSLVSGLLPGDLSLGGLGDLEGTPDREGSFPVTVRVEDRQGEAVEKELTLDVGAGDPLLILSDDLPPGNLGEAYEAELLAAGGMPPYDWLVLEGVLPAGLLLDSDGHLGGIPTQQGNFPFRVGVADQLGATDEVDLTLSILAPSRPVIDTPSPLIGGVVGEAYLSDLITASGGTGPYTWNVTGGALPPGLSFAQVGQDGQVSGIPGLAGTFHVTIRVGDSHPVVPQSSSRSFQITILDPVPLTIDTPSPLAGGMVGVFYLSDLITASGGTGAYGWSLAGGALPAGLGFAQLGEDGQITGTPIESGLFNLMLEVTDSNPVAPQTVGRSFDLTIDPAPPLLIDTPSPLPDGTQDVAYAQGIIASGGILPYTWAVVAGSLPPGITFTDGLLAGTPTTPGPFNFTVEVTDALSVTASRAFDLTIDPPPVALTITSTSPLQGGIRTQAYALALTGAGGTPPYGWALVAGALPAGLGMDGAGNITGTPIVSGDFNFTVELTDAVPDPVQMLFDLSVFEPLLILSPDSPLADGTVGVDSGSQAFQASGGDGTYTWSVIGGTVPPGLSFSQSGNEGLLEGLPTASGVFNFTVQVSDLNPLAPQTATVAYEITINDPPTLMITSPSSPLPDGMVGVDQGSQNFVASGGIGAHTWSVIGGTVPPGLSFSQSGPDGLLQGTPTASGPFNFTVQVADSNPVAPQTDVVAYDMTVNDPPTLLIISPSPPLPDGTVGTDYGDQFFDASGGTGSYTWTRLGGEFPSGLAFSQSGDRGLLNGIPIGSGSFSVDVQVEDSNPVAPQTVMMSFPIEILDPPMPVIISPGSPLGDGTVGVSYGNQDFFASDGTGAYTWSVIAGTVPPGMSFSQSGNDGRLSGIPIASGSFNFTVQVADSNPVPQTDTRAYDITIDAAPSVSIAGPTSPLTDGTVGVVYPSTNFTASGGIGSYTWTVIAGTVPPGLSFFDGGSEGILNGTPASSGSFNFTVQVEDSNPVAPQTDTRAYDITINDPPLPDLIITLPTPPSVSCPGGFMTCTSDVDYEIREIAGVAVDDNFTVRIDNGVGQSSSFVVPGIGAGATVVGTTTLGPMGDNCYNPDCITNAEVDSPGPGVIPESKEDNNTDSRFDGG